MHAGKMRWISMTLAKANEHSGHVGSLGTPRWWLGMTLHTVQLLFRHCSSCFLCRCLRNSFSARKKDSWAGRPTSARTRASCDFCRASLVLCSSLVALACICCSSACAGFRLPSSVSSASFCSCSCLWLVCSCDSSSVMLCLSADSCKRVQQVWTHVGR